MADWQYQRGLHEVGAGTFAWLQPDGSWGWSNAGLIVDGDQSLLVDTLFDVPLTARMLEAMRDAAPAAASIGTVVNTHANGDHCWGNQLIPGAEIVASRRGAAELAEVDPAKMATLMKVAGLVSRAGAAGQALGRAFGALGVRKLQALIEAAPFVDDIFGAFDFGTIQLTPPTRTFDGALDLKVGDRQVRLLEVGPAHTSGDVIVHVPDQRVVFTGDILFIGGHPIMWAGPIGNWLRACDLILELDVDVVVPGHGPVTDKAGVRGVRDYLAWVEAEARRRYEAGQDPFDAAVEMAPSAPAGLGDRERLAINVDTVYRELAGRDDRLEVIDAFALMARARRAM